MEGRWENALAEAEKALELDPLSAAVISNVAHRLVFVERYDDAIKYAKRSLSIQPNLLTAEVSLVLAYTYKRESVEALATCNKHAQLSQSKARWTVVLATVQALLGRRDEAVKTFDSALKLQDSSTIPPTLVAWVFAALNDENQMFEWLEKGLEQHDTMVTSINDNIVFKEYHSTPRYREILKRLGLDKY